MRAILECLSGYLRSSLRNRERQLLAIAVTVLSVSALHAQPYSFSTIAGGFIGDGLPATSAVINAPTGIAFDSSGNLYIAQYHENRVRKVSPDGVITTLAGTGAFGFSGDGGPASSATIRSARGVAVDAAGNVYFTDSGNHRVRKVTAGGVITTVVGNGNADSSGDGGQAINAGLQSPYGIAFDASGNLYISQSESHRVRKVTPSGVITTVAGNGVSGFSGDGGIATSASLNGPVGIALDTAGNLYISDSNNNRVRKVTPGGVITTVAGDGTTYGGSGDLATSRSIAFPFGVGIDASDNLYISNGNCLIQKVVPDGTITTITGGGTCEFSGDGGPAEIAGIGFPEGIAFDASGNLYFADSENSRIRRIVDGVINTVAGMGSFGGDGGPAANAIVSRTEGITVDGAGNIYIVDTFPNRRIRRVAPTGIIDTVVGNGQYSGGDGGLAVDAGLTQPRGIAIDPDGNLYIADRAVSRVRKVTAGGFISTIAGTGSSGFNGDGTATVSRLNRPNRVALDGNGNLYIADTNNHRIRKVTPDGFISTVAGNGIAGFSGDGGSATNASLWSPQAVAVDVNGNLYIADRNNARIRKVTPGGVISTFAGNGIFASSGDGGAATNASITAPAGITVDAGGSLYIVGPTLRKISPTGIISTVPGMPHYAYDVAIDGRGAVHLATLSGRIIKGTRERSIAHDFNGDGASDLLWRDTSSGSNAYWRSGNYATQQSVRAVTDVAWVVAGLGDFDGDNKSDILWHHTGTGANALWYSANSATARNLTTITDLQWKIAGVGDFDGDGISDILWRHSSTGANTIWKAGNAAAVQTVTGVTNVAWIVAGVGDFNADGKSDIVWRNTSTGANAVWYSGNYALAQNLTTVTNAQWKIAGVGDFDGDGKSDLLWRNGTTGVNAIWLSGNYATQQAVTAVTNVAWIAAATGDYNGDDKADIIWRHTSSGANAVWYSGNSATAQNLTAITSQQWKIVP